MVNPQKEAYKDFIKFPNKVSYLKEKSTKFIDKDDPAPSNIKEYLKSFIEDIKKKAKTPLTEEIKITSSKMDGDILILKTNTSPNWFIFFNENECGIFTSLNHHGIFVFTMRFQSPFNLGEKIKTDRKRSKRGGRKKGVKIEGSVEWAIEKFLEENPYLVQG